MPSQIKVNYVVGAGGIILMIGVIIGESALIGLGIILAIIGFIGGGTYKSKCDYCNAKFDNKADCEEHEKTHYKLSWKCEFCGKKFETKELAEKHEKGCKK